VSAEEEEFSPDERKKRSSLRYSAMVNSYKVKDSLDSRLNERKEDSAMRPAGAVEGRRGRMGTVFKKSTVRRVRRRSFHGMNSVMREPDMSLEVEVGSDGRDHSKDERISDRYTMPSFALEKPRARSKQAVSAVTNQPRRSRQRQDGSPKLTGMDGTIVDVVGGPKKSTSPLGNGIGDELDFSIVDDFLEEEGINRSRRLNASSYSRRTREKGSGLDSLLRKKDEEIRSIDTKSSIDESIGSLSAFATTDSSPSSTFGGSTPSARLHRNTFEVGFLEGLRSSLEMSDDLDLDDFDDTCMPITPSLGNVERDRPRRQGIDVPTRRNQRHEGLGLETIVGSPLSPSPNLRSESPPEKVHGKAHQDN
jgi:hypothetical protein